MGVRDMTNIVFITIMGAMVIIGLLCAAQVDRSTPMVKRLALLAPALSAIYTLTQIFWGAYHVYGPDVARSIALLALYWIAARMLHAGGEL